jgi:hypothetical protein
MISRHPKPRIAVAYAALCAWLIYAATGCSSGELEPSPSGETVAQAQQAVDSFCTYDPSIPTVGGSRTATHWKSLGGSNFPSAVDVNTDLACVLGIFTPGQVICYFPDTLTTPAIPKITNWGSGCDSSGSGCTGVPVASSPPKGVAILKHTQKPRRNGGAYYGIYVLLQDNRVMVTQGDSDHWFEGDNFKSYSLFVSPVSSTGQTLSFQKIVWVNEVGMSDFTVIPRLLGLTTDNALYYTDPSRPAWQLFKQGVRDVSHLPGRGDTMVLTTGEVYYGAFNPINEWRGYLPPPLGGSNIVAVGGMYALTNDGCHGNCAENMSTFCAGDDTRILHFDWLKWKWEPLAWIAQQDSRFMNGYYPIEPGYTCNGCSPQITKTIVDPHGFGGNIAPIDSFNVGPFVFTPVGQRIQYYNPPIRPILSELQQCMNGACAGDCGQLLDGTPCPPDGVGARVCENRQCKACGGAGQFPCPGLDCSKVPEGAVVHYGRCKPRSEVFPGWRPMPGGAGAYSAPAANRRRDLIDLYAKRVDTGDLHFRAGRFSNTERTWDWGTWTSLGRPANGIMGKPSSTGWILPNPCTAVSCPPWWLEGGAVVVRTQDGNARHIAVNYLDAAGNFQGWSQIPGGDLEQDPAIIWVAPYLYVFAPGTDHQFWFSKNDISGGYNAANWTGWQHIPGGWLTSEGSAVVDNQSGVIYLASRGTNNLYHVIKSTDGGATWGNWNYVPSPVTFTSGPLLIRYQGELTLLGTAASADGNQRTFLSKSEWAAGEIPSWTPFESTDPYPVGQPAAVITGFPDHDWNDHIEIFVLGTDNQLWRNWYQ